MLVEFSIVADISIIFYWRHVVLRSRFTVLGAASLLKVQPTKLWMYWIICIEE